jgi:alpha-galactosidase
MAIESLREHLQTVMAPALLAHLEDSPGWAVEAGGQVLAWERLGETHRAAGASTWRLVAPEGLQADVMLTLDEAYHAAVLQVTLHNRGSATSTPLTALKVLQLRWAGLPREAVGVRALGGGLTCAYYPPDAYKEHAVWFRPGLSQVLTIESGQDGRSSNRDLPFLQMDVAGGIDAGLVAAIEWSGEWRQSFGPVWAPERARESLIWEAAIPINGLTLAPGERLELPAVHLLSFAGDQDAGGNACRRYLRERITPRLDGRPPVPPASYDHWFGIGCDIDEPMLRGQVDRAAAMGLEYFVLDAGWFAGCGVGHDFSPGTGNWERVDARKFPDGLEPFASYVRARGLQFGLWFEPERAHRESDLARSHPEWFFDIGTAYLHLNLALPAVQAYLISLIGGWIERLDLRWSRWDYNIGPRPYWQHADPTGKIQFSYFAGLYHVLDTLMAAYPHWLVECCASGGRRIDLGTLRRAHTVWFSDHTDDALVCRLMQTGANRFLPGYLLNSAVVGTKEGDASTRADAAILSRMCGAFAVNGDTSAWSPAVVARVRQLVEIYRGFRHLLGADFYPLTPQPRRPDECEVVQFVAPSGNEAVLLGIAGPMPARDARVRLKGLDRGATYSVRDLLQEGETRERGVLLLDEGILVPLATGVAVWKLERVDA